MDECIEWNGGREGYGYGTKRIKGKIYKTHRLAFAWANGYWDEHGINLPHSLCVLHKCDNPSCVNPDHLFGGDRAENNRDRARKGRYENQGKLYCNEGHELFGPNMRIYGGRRYCLICKTNRKKLAWLRKKFNSRKAVDP